jgi:hypothetical protein
MRWCEVECGGFLINIHTNEGEVINIHTMRVREGALLINIYPLNICNDVRRARSGKIGQNVLTRHFLASLHVCDTIVLGTETSFKGI